MPVLAPLESHVDILVGFRVPAHAGSIGERKANICTGLESVFLRAESCICATKAPARSALSLSFLPRTELVDTEGKKRFSHFATQNTAGIRKASQTVCTYSGQTVSWRSLLLVLF